LRTSRRFATEDHHASELLPRWPLPELDPGLASAIYHVELEELRSAAIRLERCSVSGIRHFSAYRRVVPLDRAPIVAREIAREEREEEDYAENPAAFSGRPPAGALTAPEVGKVRGPTHEASR